MEHNYRIKTVLGTEYHIYYLKGNGISLRTLRGGAQILLRDGFYDFDCLYDYKKNVIHIIGQNSGGSILHILHDQNGWQKKELLTGKLKLPYPKYFRMVEYDGRPMAFYTIRHDGDSLLVSQIPGEDELPNVIDYVKDSNPRFWVGVDDETLRVIYTDREGKQTEKRRIDMRWMSAPISWLNAKEECRYVFSSEGDAAHIITVDVSGGERKICDHQKKKGSHALYTIEEKETDVTGICVFRDGASLACISIGKESGRYYRLQNGVWKKDEEKSAFLSGQNLLRKVILLGEKREEGIGCLEEGRLNLLFPQEGGAKENETAALYEKTEYLQAKITDMERRIVRIEQKLRKENGAR